MSPEIKARYMHTIRRFIIAFIALELAHSCKAHAQTGCLQTFTVSCDPTVAACQGDGFVNSGPNCDYANAMLDIVRCGTAVCTDPRFPPTTDLMLLNYDTCALAGQTITAAALQTSVFWSHIDPGTPYLVGDYVNWTPFPCPPNYITTSGTSAINNFPTNQIPLSGPLRIPLNPAGINTFAGHTKIRAAFVDVGTGYSEVDVWSHDGNAPLSPELMVWFTGSKCNLPTPSPTVAPTPTTTPRCQWNGTACAVSP